MFRHLFPSCFLTNETPEKVANVFLVRHQFCHRYKTFDLNRWRNKLNLQKQTKNVHKILKDMALLWLFCWSEIGTAMNENSLQLQEMLRLMQVLLWGISFSSSLVCFGNGYSGFHHLIFPSNNFSALYEMFFKENIWWNDNKKVFLWKLFPVSPVSIFRGSVN